MGGYDEAGVVWGNHSKRGIVLLLQMGAGLQAWIKISI